jgi:hypothetical protein
MAFIFSRTEPFRPTVAHMIAFLMGRLEADAAARERIGRPAEARAKALPVWRRKVRRFMGRIV